MDQQKSRVSPEQIAAGEVARLWRAMRYTGFAHEKDAIGMQLAREWPELYAALDQLQRTWR